MELVGREKELSLLFGALERKVSQFIALYGRRRVGKTYLVREAFDNDFCFYHTGYYNQPKKTQLDAFYKSLIKAGLAPECEKPRNWNEAFELLEGVIERHTEPKKILFLDEISWMDTPRSDFVSALEHFWNAFASARKDIVLIICSSATSWVIDNVLHSKGGFHNRLTLSIHLQPFTLNEVEEYVNYLGVALNRQQILEGYMALGGVPYYWSLIEKGMSINQYIDYLFFQKSALLKDEFVYLFHSLFNKPEAYISIINALAQKRKGLTRDEILKAVGLQSAESFSRKLEELENCDFIRVFPSRGKRKETLIQLIDPFILFYYRFIEHRSLDPQFWMHQSNMPETNSWKGYAFELVCLLHVEQMKWKLGISSVLTNVYSFSMQQNLENGIQGSQIDLVMERADRITNLFEMKYSHQEYLVTKEIDESLRRKRSDYQIGTKTKNAIQLTLVTPYGVIPNSYSNNLDSVLTTDDLFHK